MPSRQKMKTLCLQNINLQFWQNNNLFREYIQIYPYPKIALLKKISTRPPSQLVIPPIVKIPEQNFLYTMALPTTLYGSFFLDRKVGEQCEIYLVRAGSAGPYFQNIYIIITTFAFYTFIWRQTWANPLI